MFVLKKCNGFQVINITRFSSVNVRHMKSNWNRMELLLLLFFIFKASFISDKNLAYITNLIHSTDF